jgi:hypothetical protein
MQIEEPGTSRRFEQRLAEEQGWPLPVAERVTDEYRRFLYLAAIAGFEVTPSRAVDEAWHLHLRLPHYREILCGRILGHPLHHLPGTGTAEDEARCAAQYEDTLDLYERVFGEPAPDEIWPRLFPRGRGRRAWARKRRTINTYLAMASLTGGFGAVLSGAFAVSAVLFGAGLVFGYFARPIFWTPGRGGNCGGSSSCNSSCGPDCGGGGCGGGD